MRRTILFAAALLLGLGIEAVANAEAKPGLIGTGAVADAETNRFRLEKFPVAIYYDAVSDIEKGDADAALAVIVIHGWGGGITPNTNVIKFHERFAGAQVIMPLFPRKIVMERNGFKDDGRALWNDSWSTDLSIPGSPDDDWRGGGDAAGTNISSFDVIDEIIAQLSDRNKFPNMKRIVLTGFSAGGQFVNRYAAVGKGKARRGIRIDYVAMSPSTYLRLDDTVSWHYGLNDRPRYSAGLSFRKILRNLSSRRVWLGCGSGDTTKRSLDITPAAITQGANRLDRFNRYREHIKQYPGWYAKSSFYVFDGIGHESGKAYETPELVDFIVNGDRQQ